MEWERRQLEKCLLVAVVGRLGTDKKDGHELRVLSRVLEGCWVSRHSEILIELEQDLRGLSKGEKDLGTPTRLH